jgi:hypothetical protein
LPDANWQRRSAGDGNKGERLHDWAYLELADLDASDDGDTFTGPSERLSLTINDGVDGPLSALMWQSGGCWQA